MLAAQQRLAFTVALFASGSRLKRRGVELMSRGILPRSIRLRGLAAVLSADDKAARL